METRRYRQTSRLMLGFAAVLVGLGLSRKFQGISFTYIVVPGTWMLISFKKARLVSVYSVVLFGLLLGLWRGGEYMGHVRDIQAISKERVVLTGTALSDSVYNEKSQVSFDMGSLQLSVPYDKKLVGKVRVSGFGEPMVYRGDRVEVQGKFYPARGSLIAYLSYSQMKVTGKSQSALYSFARHFSVGLQNTLSEPQASFAMGILVGQRSTLPADVTSILSAVGLTHIIAVSGYNLTIMLRAGRKIFGKRSKFQVLVGSLVLVLGFLLMTGMSASIVRAAIISCLSLGAWYYGRKVKPLLIILLTAAVTALWNPLYLWSDIGWYLSFLAFFGVLILAPEVRRRLFGKEPRGLLGELVLETMCAQVMTLPIVLYIFNATSLLALPANILIVPLIPLAMLLSFVSGLAGMFIAPLAGWIAWPAQLLLTYIIDIATIFARVPNMQLSLNIGLLGMTVMYAAFVLVLLSIWRKNTQNAKITGI